MSKVRLSIKLFLFLLFSVVLVGCGNNNDKANAKIHPTNNIKAHKQDIQDSALALKEMEQHSKVKSSVKSKVVVYDSLDKVVGHINNVVNKTSGAIHKPSALKRDIKNIEGRLDFLDSKLTVIASVDPEIAKADKQIKNSKTGLLADASHRKSTGMVNARIKDDESRYQSLDKKLSVLEDDRVGVS
jgi:hypothetical protein